MEEVTWNNDPEWVAYVIGLTPVIEAMAAKYTTCEGLREDCVNEALMELLKHFPQDSTSYAAYQAGTITETKWKKQLDKYCRQIARNRIFTYLSAIKTGNWYIGRKKRVVDPITKEVSYTRSGPRYASVEDLEEEHGIQIDTDKNVCWTKNPHQARDSLLEEWNNPERFIP